MKIVVTGGAGFIGSHIVDSYISKGHDVTVIDDFSSGNPENINTSAKFIESSIGDSNIEDLWRMERFDIISHHAAQIDVRTSTKDPARDANINIVEAVRFLKWGIENGVKKIIFASTGGAIYGEPDIKNIPGEIPMPNENHKIAPLAPYGLSKYCFEKYIDYFHLSNDLNYTILRYGNVYGPRQDPHGEAGVVAIFAENLLNGSLPIIFGDGNQTRDFIFVGDIVRANLLALQSGNKNIFNIGTGRETSVNKILAVLQNTIGTNVEPIYKEARLDEVYRIALNCQKAGKTLNWQAETSLEEGLLKTAEFFKNKRLIEK